MTKPSADNQGNQPLGLPLNDQLGPLPEAPIIGVSRFGSVFRGYSADHMRAYAAEQVVAERERTAAAVMALKIAAQCIEAAYNDQWASADALSDDFDNAMSALADLLGPNAKVTGLSPKE